MRSPKPFFLTLILFLTFAGRSALAQGSMTVYDDTLRNGWQNWSWCATDLSATTPVHAGTNSVKISYTAAWQGFYLHHTAFDTSLYQSLSFWVNGGSTSGRTVQIAALVNDSALASVALSSYVTVSAGTWQKVTIPLTDLGIASKSNVTGFWLQESSGNSQPDFFVDDITFDGSAIPAFVNVTADANRTLQIVNDRHFGVNTAVWDNVLNTPATISLLTASGLKAFRFPGGSLSDEYHWQTNTTLSNTWTWATNFDGFANVARQAKGQVFLTINYGTGTVQEAVDWVKYSNVTKAYGFKYWEIGNENYGGWETDTHARPHDPYTYALAVKSYMAAMKAIDPTIKIGVVVVTGEDSFANYTDHPATNPRTGQVHNGWTPVLLSTLKALGVTPDYLIYHRYEQGPGEENDALLLQKARTWPNDATDLRQQLTDYLGAAGASVELVCTENNSVYTNPGKQSTSLVNGLYWADSLGSLLQTEFRGMVWWDLRNGQDTGQNNSPSLYGWRQYGDYGILSYANDLYPTYYIAKLLSRFARSGDKVVQATSDYSLLSVYAARRTGTTNRLALLVINKSPTSTLTARFALTNFVPGTSITVNRYGIAQDEAARTGTGSPDVKTYTTTGAAKSFKFTFPPYSATVLVLKP